ncbi:MAG: heme-binding protein [Pseudomonadota bacterium]
MPHNVYIGLLALLVVLITPLTSGNHAMAAVETAPYKVLENLAERIELREYPPQLLAEVDVRGERQQAASRAFPILAGFIFGGNETSAKVAMTAPVTAAQNADAVSGAPQKPSQKIAMTAPVTVETPSGAVAGDAVWTVAFVMPKEFTLETLPTPNDERVRIRATEPNYSAAIQFTGRYTDGNFSAHEEKLREAMRARGLEAAGSPTVAYYNGPFTPFFLRRNEVIIPVKNPTAE